MIKLEKIEDYPNYSEVIDKEAIFSGYDPSENVLLFRITGRVNFRFIIKGYKEMFFGYEQVKYLLNPDFSDEIKIEESKVGKIPFVKYQFIKES